MARRLGIKVEKFSLGFGKKLFGFKLKGTDFCLCLIPFGGYVKLAGETRETCKGKDWEYLSRSPGDRAKVIFAGPLFNYMLAFLFLWWVFCIGYPRISPEVGKVIEGMPAQEVGFMEGDVITEVNSKKVEYWFQVLETIRDGKYEGPLKIAVRRKAEKINFEVTPEIKKQKDYFGKEHQVKLVGIAPTGDLVYERYNIFSAFKESFLNIVRMTGLTLKSIFYLIIGYLSFKEAVVGPVGIYQMTSVAAQYGFNTVLHMTSMLSLALAIFNILPIPILDGGHILFLGIEKMRKRPLRPKTEQRIADVGLGFILILAVFILFNDLIKFGYWDKLNNLLVNTSEFIKR